MTHDLKTLEGLLERVEAAEAARAADMPTEQDALMVMFRAYSRLKELGWKDAIYCPKDGSTFDSISVGSTGIHPCYYEGRWPSGRWWVLEAGDLWPARPVLWRPASEGAPSVPARLAPGGTTEHKETEG